VLTIAGVGVFSILTGAVAQHFLAGRVGERPPEPGHGEQAIIERLDELAARLDGIEALSATHATSHGDLR
jgi:hypothetical protein